MHWENEKEIKRITHRVGCSQPSHLSPDSLAGRLVVRARECRRQRPQMCCFSACPLRSGRKGDSERGVFFLVGRRTVFTRFGDITLPSPEFSPLSRFLAPTPRLEHRLTSVSFFCILEKVCSYRQILFSSPAVHLTFQNNTRLCPIL